MAKTTKLSEKITFGLQILYRRARVLPRVEQRWKDDDVQLPPYVTPDDVYADKVSFRMEWSSDMDRLEWLNECYSEGRMSAEQGRQHEELLHTLRGMLPVMERMRLALPSALVLEAVAAAHGVRPSSSR